MLSLDSMAQPTPHTSDHLPIASSSDLSIPNGNPLNSSDQPATKHQHIWLVTGPAGCGKSTIAQYVANSLNLPYLEGDEFHPQSNVDKMSRGIPLEDNDRWDWLTRLRDEAVNRLNSGAQGVVVTCSALKRKYRDVIRVAPYYSSDVLVHFVYLHANEETLLQRVGARKGHYMGAAMVHSQFDILEVPKADEKDVITVDVSGTVEEVEQDALAKINAAIEKIILNDAHSHASGNGNGTNGKV